MNKVVDTQELLPCPNPWCTARSRPLPCALKREGWRVRCECGVASFRFDTEAEAIRAWNTRSTQCSGDTQEVERACCGSREGMPHFWDCETNDPNLRTTHSPSEAVSEKIRKLRTLLEAWVQLADSARRPKTDSNTAFLDWRDIAAAKGDTLAVLSAGHDAALSIPSDKTVGLLREAREWCDDEARWADGQDLQRWLIRRDKIDSHLKEPTK